MGSTSSKLDSRNYILANILHIIYDVNLSSISDLSLYMDSGVICIDAKINNQKRTFQHMDGSLVDILYQVLNNTTITSNPYIELDECIKKYNEHIRLMGILDSQGL